MVMTDYDNTNRGAAFKPFQKIGCLFPNDKKGNEKAPDYSGPLDGLHQDWKIASWKEMKDDNAYMSLQVSEFKKKEPEPNTLDDIIPEFGDNIKDEEASSAHPTLAVPF